MHVEYHVDAVLVRGGDSVSDLIEVVRVDLARFRFELRPRHDESGHREPLRSHGLPITVDHGRGRVLFGVLLVVLAQGVQVGPTQSHVTPEVIDDSLVFDMQRSKLTRFAGTREVVLSKLIVARG